MHNFINFLNPGTVAPSLSGNGDKPSVFGAYNFMEQEQWKPILGYEGFYEASSYGNIKRVGRNKNMSLGDSTSGYKSVALCREGVPITHQVHRVVFSAFNGPIPSGYQIDHKDENKKNNNISNLRIVTGRQNVTSYYSTRPGTSKYIGVNYNKRARQWRAHIRINGKQIYLGKFQTELEAAAAYQTALKSIT